MAADAHLMLVSSLPLTSRSRDAKVASCSCPAGLAPTFLHFFIHYFNLLVIGAILSIIIRVRIRVRAKARVRVRVHH